MDGGRGWTWDGRWVGMDGGMRGWTVGWTVRLTICGGKVINHGGLLDLQYCFSGLSYRADRCKRDLWDCRISPPETFRDRCQEI
jgi:hypothetical protein